MFATVTGQKRCSLEDVTPSKIPTLIPNSVDYLLFGWGCRGRRSRPLHPHLGRCGGAVGPSAPPQRITYVFSGAAQARPGRSGVPPWRPPGSAARAGRRATARANAIRPNSGAGRRATARANAIRPNSGAVRREQRRGQSDAAATGTRHCMPIAAASRDTVTDRLSEKLTSVRRSPPSPCSA